jgi:hypothetical protein
MGQEFKRLKTMATIQRAFLNCLNKKTWEECKTTYHKHCSDQTLANLVLTFIGWKDKTVSRKKKTSEDAEKRELASYPKKFIALISQAQQWLDMQNKSKELSQ